MLTMQLPLFPPELTFINRQISFQKKDGKVYYFHGLFPLFSHEESDLKSFRLITSQLAVSGNVKLIEIAKAFGVTYISVKRSVNLLRKEGPEGFFKKEEAKPRTPHVLTGEVVEKVQRYLDKGYSPSEIAGKLNLKANTIQKAIQAGRLRKKKQKITVQQGMNKS
jgi:transposase